MQFPKSEQDFDKIVCNNHDSKHNKVNVTSCVKEETMEDLLGVPFEADAVKRGSCTLTVSVDMEAKKKDQLPHYNAEPQKSNMKSSSASVLVNLVTLVTSLTFALVN
jgi:hypothetical protein